MSKRIKVIAAVTALAAPLVALSIWSQPTVVRSAVVRFQAHRELKLLAGEIAGTIRGEGRFTISIRPVATSNPRRPLPIELSPQARISIARLDGFAASSQDPEVLMAAGIGDIVDQRGQSGVKLLERAHAVAPRNGPILINLAAAYLSRAEPGDTMRGFDIARQATRIAPVTPAALFNVAVAAERLLPSADASEVWKQYLQVEHDPIWRTEVEVRTRTLDGSQGEIGGLDRVSALRVELSRHVLPGWAKACIEGSGSRTQELARASLTLVRQIGGSDRHLQDLVAWVLGDSVGRGCDTNRARAYLDLDAARQLYSEDRQAEASILLEKLSRTTLHSDGPLATEVRVLLAPTKYLQGDHAQAQRECELAADAARLRHYFSILGRAQYIRGWAAQDNSRFQEAFDAYREALTAYAAGNDAEGVAVTQTITASLLDAVGEYRSGWEHREVALSSLRTLPPSKATYSILSEATKAALRDDLLETALELSHISMSEAQADRSALRTAEASIDRASIALKLGDTYRANAALAVARREVAAGGDARGFDRLQAKLLLLEAGKNTVANAEVVMKLDAAIDSYTRAGSDILAAKLYLARGRAHLVRGDTRAAEIDFKEGINRFERVRVPLRDAAVRVSYFDEAWQLFDEVIALLVSERRFDEALATAERQRGRDLRDALTSSIGRDRPDKEIPADSRVIYYVVLAKAVVIWVIGPDTRRVEQVAIDRGELEHLIGAFVNELSARSPEPSVRSSANQLHHILIDPIERSLDGAKRLYVVADPLLQRIPYPALWQERTDSYLIERFEIAMVPSFGIIQRNQRATGRRSDALVVSAGGKGQSLGVPLAGLPYATLEADEVARLYPASKQIKDSDLQASSVRTELPQHTVFHFAGHSLVNPDAPQLSRLIVSPTRSEDGALYAYEIEALDLRRVEIVVLSACDTAAGRSSRSEGVISVARSFMKAGVPTVIATLWSVEDSTAKTIFRHFHERLAEGADPIGVLAKVQRTMIRSGAADRRVPARWAAPIVVTRLIH